MLKTDLCRALGIEHPVFCAGIGAAAGAGLVAAVSNAGGCGVLGTASLPGKFVRAEIERLKAATDQPFGVNLLLPLLRRGQAEACVLHTDGVAGPKPHRPLPPTCPGDVTSAGTRAP